MKEYYCSCGNSGGWKEKERKNNCIFVKDHRTKERSGWAQLSMGVGDQTQGYLICFFSNKNFYVQEKKWKVTGQKIQTLK